ncbi:hypothetical protein ACFL1H_07645 [Nanoarchaeota archaeon]
MTEPNLEEIATNLANMDKNHKLDYIEKDMLAGFFSMPGVVTHDENGAPVYKTKFNEEEKNKIGDMIFDNLSMHAHQRHFNYKKGEFEDLKNKTDKYGNSHADYLVEQMFGVSRDIIKQQLDDVDEIDHRVLGKLIEEPTKRYVQTIQQKILAPLREKHVDKIKDFITEGIANYSPADKKVYKKMGDAVSIEKILPFFGEYAQKKYRIEDEELQEAA